MLTLLTTAGVGLTVTNYLFVGQTATLTTKNGSIIDGNTVKLESLNITLFTACKLCNLAVVFQSKMLADTFTSSVVMNGYSHAAFGCCRKYQN